MTPDDFAAWEEWLAGYDDRRVAARVAARLENKKPPSDRVQIVESRAVLEVVYEDALDGALYKRVYQSLEAAQRRTAAIYDKITGGRS